tara:strand:- start:26216 stop:26923 length:708 start_codon:yes stop_codon:yes gene_type:complete
MIDIIYKIVTTVINKELRGNITPDEFNKIAKQVQDEIFTEYFDDNNRQQNRNNKGLTNKNHANLTKQIRQKISMFHESTTLVYDEDTDRFVLPDDLYFIEDNGLLFVNSVIEEAQTADLGYLLNSLAAPSVTFPVYETFKDSIKVYPTEIQSKVNCRYLRKPLDPKWSYTIVGGVEFYDNTLGDHQDFELHISELPKIVVNMLSYLGINIREGDVVQYAEGLKRTDELKEINQPR